MNKLHTYLNFPGNTEEAFNFYKSVFGGEFNSVVRFKDLPMPGVQLSDEDANKIMHIGLPVGPSLIMATDALESMGFKVVPGNNSYIMVEVDSKAEADRIFNALSAGGKVEMAMADQPWGDYYGSFRDKYGIGWMVDYGYPKEKK